MALFRSSPDTFFVEEQPAYLPQGAGPHTFVWIEKRDLTTPEAVKRLARALGVQDRDAGYAGMKDRHATTRQWVSLPDVEPERAAQVSVEGISVLETKRHQNKLRVGHLRGNRFEVVLTDVAEGERALLEGALLKLVREGLPNRYGQQRFGGGGDNAEAGRALLRGERRERDPRKRKLWLSALQSAVFNRVLELRAATGGLLKVREGDVLQKVGSGGTFVTTDVETDQRRVDAGEIVPTAPLPGGRVETPPPGSAAAALEREAVSALGMTDEEFGRAGRDMPGTRRPVIVRITPGEPLIQEDGAPDRLRLRFALPAGSYATVLLDALALDGGVLRFEAAARTLKSE